MMIARMAGAVATLLVLGGSVGRGAGPQEAPASVAALKQFSTASVDADYQAANLRAVLRLLSELAGVSLVIDPSVSSTATVDLKLTAVAWDQAMDVVLRSNGLTFDLDGRVLRVITREARSRELDAEVKQRQTTEAVELQTTRFRLNYSAAASVAKLLVDARLVSGRGAIEFEERTNLLIVREHPRNLQEIQSLIADLDRPEPQVEIEAKILRTSRDAAKALGVQWGLNGRLAPELANTTTLAFPNRGTVGGRVSDGGPALQGPQDPRASASEQTATAVDLPVGGATGAAGLSLGAVNGAFGLDVALSALEHDGKARILSTPRVTTQNNRQAEITQGFQVPIQIVANNTVTVQFKDAALKLMVTPQITPANTVIMRIILENGTPDFSRAVNGNPSISTQRAETQVQVADGETTVIGGILQTTEATTVDRTPGLGRLPLFGWFFRRSDVRNESQELLIFITPRILRG